MSVSDVITSVRGHLDFGPDYDKGRYMDRWHIILCILAAVLIVVNWTRMYDNCFWGDEVYSITTSQKSFSDIVYYCFHWDANPFLYYMVLRVICLIVGWTPFAYHFSAMLPYILIIILSVTVIYRTFGKTASLTFMVMATFLESAVFYIPEARMYELGVFTVLASYLSLYFVLKEGKARHYLLFIISTVCAGLTHYYCLIAVAFLYIVLILDIMITERKKTKKVVRFALLLVVIAACCCAPVLYERFTTVTGDFWITEYMSFFDCIKYLFSSKISLIIFAVFLIALVIMLYRLFVNNSNRGKGVMKHFRNMDSETVWVIAGIISLFGTIGVGLYISVTFTPMLIERYLFPATVIAWLLLAVGLSRCDIHKTLKTCIPVAIALCLLFAGIPNMVQMLDTEHSNETSHNEIMDVTQDYVDDGYIIVTDMNHLNQNVLDYYYPGNTHLYIDNYDVPTLDHSKKYLLLCGVLHTLEDRKESGRTGVHHQ